MEDIQYLNPLTDDIPLPNVGDTLWIWAKWLDLPGVPEWKGFMNCVTRDEIFEKTKDRLYWLHQGRKWSERTVEHNICSSISRQSARRSSARIILGQVDIKVLERDTVNAAMKDLLTEPPSLDTLNQNRQLIGLATKMENKLEQLKGNGLTATLWIQYFNMVTLMKEYIFAERSGDWNVHLKCVQQMIPFFSCKWSFCICQIMPFISAGYVDALICNVHFSSTEQHTDVAKLTLWLENHPPFPSTQEIMSLETGVVDDSNIDCYNAISVGKIAMTEVVGKHFSDVNLSRRNEALPMACVNGSIKIIYYVSLVDLVLLFKKISVVKQTNEDLRMYLEYELAPFPLALFNEARMRKTKISSLYDLFATWEKDTNFENTCIVVDGGFLYNAKKSVDIHFGEDTGVTTKQDHFLSNDTNKSRLISMLSAKLKDNGIEFLESSGDAATLIVSTATKKCFMSDNVTIVEDVDMLVLLTALALTEREIVLENIKATSLKLHRYNSFTKPVTNIKPDISSLSPTAGAAKQHTFRVYHQVQQWLGKELPPDLWGWKCAQNRPVPTTTEDAVAPEGMLNLIFCRSTVYNTCHGDCLNGIATAINEEDENEDLSLDTIDYMQSCATRRGPTPPVDDAPRKKLPKMTLKQKLRISSRRGLECQWTRIDSSLMTVSLIGWECKLSWAKSSKLSSSVALLSTYLRKVTYRRHDSDALIYEKQQPRVLGCDWFQELHLKSLELCNSRPGCTNDCTGPRSYDPGSNTMSSRTRVPM
ncbi:hypothetical protein PR048_007832 [Dryococelus australis]|uniref:Uncharacterized protein n=1 Tax=Dryococelus australis TaxID=614101 RepID=A0ABQ9HVD5_9NEOP|nr:hypothetical protein PR048_007832 [Dryococelus australis]